MFCIIIVLNLLLFLEQCLTLSVSHAYLVWEAASNEVQAYGPCERVPDQSQGMGTKTEKVPQSGKSL